MHLYPVRALPDGEFSAAERGGLIEAHNICQYNGQRRQFSAAERGGLIEADPTAPTSWPYTYFPPQNAAASLKRIGRDAAALDPRQFSAAERGGLIEASLVESASSAQGSFSAAERGGLIEATRGWARRARRRSFSAAERGGLIEASWPRTSCRPGTGFSAAERGGLIEAPLWAVRRCPTKDFPPQNAAASLKRVRASP